jgi:DNA polymerase III subunit delta'
VIIDADRMRTEAANAFLKTLEEPPDGSILFLLTASPERLLSTILSRCVNIPLIAEHDVREKLDGEEEMLTTLIKNAKAGFDSVSRALTIKSVFASILAKRKLAISKVHETSLKEEQDHYKNATDGEWLKDREKHYDSLIQSDYLFERSKFIDLLILWLGDLVRIKSGASRLDFKEYEAGMSAAASKESLESLIQRMDAMEELRGLFETNVSEPLALEVCFMKAFA